MYSLDINFLNDREVVAEAGEERQPIADKQFLIGGGAIALVAIATAASVYFFLQYASQGLQEELAGLTSKEQVLDTKLKQIANDEQAVKAIDDRTDALVKLFVGSIPPSAILQDIRARAPGNVQVASIDQSGKGLKIVGLSTSYEGVNDFLLLLQSSPYLNTEMTKLGSAKLRAESKDIKVSVIDYEITSTLVDKSATDLLPELQKSGAEGTVTRIKLLQQKGAIK
jgi:type IV pilus assembly protein PilN